MNEIDKIAYFTKAVDIVDLFMEKNRRYYVEAMNIVMATLVESHRDFIEMHDHNPIHHIESRIKTNESIIIKLLKHHSPISTTIISRRIKDVAGIRVVCDFINDVYAVASLLGHSGLMVIRSKDYICRPKANGYRSLQMVVAVPIIINEKWIDIPVEIQIRTVAMDIWGRLEHKLRYKSDRNSSKELYDRLRQCADQLADIDTEIQGIYNSREKNSRE